MLVESLLANWAGPPGGGPWIADANVGLFSIATEPGIVPDAVVSVGVEHGDIAAEEQRSYFLWVKGKPPEVVVEVVSDDEGGEEGAKLLKYAAMRIGYYVVFDPGHDLGDEDLRVYVCERGRFVRTKLTHFVEVGLGVCLWDGEYEGLTARWLRWCDRGGRPIPTGKEAKEEQSRRADAEARRASAAEERASAAEEKFRLLAERLRQLGVDPDQS